MLREQSSKVSRQYVGVARQWRTTTRRDMDMGRVVEDSEVSYGVLKTKEMMYLRGTLGLDVALLADFLEINLAVDGVLDARDQEAELGLDGGSGRHLDNCLDDPWVVWV